MRQIICLEPRCLFGVRPGVNGICGSELGVGLPIESPSRNVVNGFRLRLAAETTKTKL